MVEKWIIMSLNTSKTKIMLYSVKAHSVVLDLDGQLIERVRSMKYLGVLIDEKLSFSLQAEYATSKATNAFSKVDRQINDRSSLSVQTSITLHYTSRWFGLAWKTQ